jgi:hypothetical protein
MHRAKIGEERSKGEVVGAEQRNLEEGGEGNVQDTALLPHLPAVEHVPVLIQPELPGGGARGRCPSMLFGRWRHRKVAQQQRGRLDVGAYVDELPGASAHSQRRRRGCPPGRPAPSAARNAVTDGRRTLN